MPTDRPLRIVPFKRPLTFRPWRFRILGANGEIVTPSQGYASRQARDDTMQLIATSQFVIVDG